MTKKTHLLDPLGIAGPTQSELAKPVAAAETARWEQTESGTCPVCKAQMKVTTCGAHKAYVCLDHRVALPMPDQEPTA